MIRRRLIVGACSNVVGKITAVATWFFLTPFVLSRIEPSGYALWVLMGSLASYGLLLDFGVGGALVKYVAEHVARGDRAAAKTFVASASCLYSGLALVAVAINIVIALLLPRVLAIAPEHASTAVWLVILTGLNVAVAIACATPDAVLRGLQRYDLHNAISIANSLVEAVGVIIALTAGWGVIGMVAVFIPVNALTGVTSAWLVKRIAPDLAIGWRGASRAAMRQMASFSTSVSVIQIAGRLQTKTDEFVIALFRSLTAVTPYALARKLGEVGELIALQFLKVILPLASELEAADRAERLRTLHVVATRITLAIAAPAAVMLVLMGGPILSVWVGAEYAPHADLVAVLALASLIATSQWPAVQVLQGMGRHRIVAWSALGAGVANVGLSILLLPPFGLLGVAFGTLIPAAAAAVGVVMPFAHRTLRLSWSRALREIWLPGLAPAGAAGVFLWALPQSAKAPSIDAVVGCGVVTAVLFAAGYLSMPAAGPERQLLADVLAAGPRQLRRLRRGRTVPQPLGR